MTAQPVRRQAGSVSPIGDMVQRHPSIRIEPWPDPVTEETGHDLRSLYVERYWVGVLGPSSAWLARLLIDRLDEAGHDVELDLSETAERLGLGRKVGRHSTFARSFERLERFGVARQTSSRSIAVRRHLPMLSPGQIQRLPKGLAADHDAWIASEEATWAERAGQTERAEGIALGLATMGESPGVISHLLRRWGFGPTTADRAARRAMIRPVPSATDDHEIGRHAA